MDKLIEFFSGKKTYAVALAMLVYAGTGWALGYVEQAVALSLALEALAIAGLRAGVAKK